MIGLLNALSRSHLGRGANRGSSKCCRTKQPAVVRLFKNRDCQFEFIPLRQRVPSLGRSPAYSAKWPVIAASFEP